MKRSFTIGMGVVVVCLLLLFANLGVFAAEKTGAVQEGYFDGLDYSVLSPQSAVQLYSTADETAAKAAILEALQNRQTKVDLSKYNLTAGEAVALHMETVYSHPELFYVNTACSYSFTPEGNKDPLDCKAAALTYRFSTELNPGGTYASYASDPAKIEEKRKGIEAEVAGILASVGPGMTAAEKALAVHDRIALNTAYDTPSSKLGYPTTAHRMDSLFLDKKAVCQGYMLGYKYVLSKLNINAICVTSDTMNHGWNMVELDGKWYHVDVTHDDPTNVTGDDVFARVSHENFLRSNAGILAVNANRQDWVPCQTAGTVATADYEGFWQDKDGESVEGGMFYANGAWYYMRGTAIVKFQNETETVLKDLGYKYFWETEDGAYLADAGCRIGVYNGRVYYNTPAEIRSINVSGGDDRLEQDVTLTEEGYWVYGIRIDDTLLYYGITTDANLKRTVYGPIHLAFSFQAQKNGNTIKITTFHQPAAGSMLYLAGYAGNVLISTKIIPITDSSTYETSIAEMIGADTFKVFAWNKLSPIAKVVTIE